MCGVDKPASIEFFSVRTDFHGELRRQCRECFQVKKRVSARKWVLGNKDKWLEYDRKRYIRDREKRIRFACLIQDRNRAIKHKSGGAYTLAHIWLIKESQNHKCYYCLGDVMRQWS